MCTPQLKAQAASLPGATSSNPSVGAGAPPMVDSMRRRILALAPIVGPQGLPPTVSAPATTALPPPGLVSAAPVEIGTFPSKGNQADTLSIVEVFRRQANVNSRPWSRESVGPGMGSIGDTPRAVDVVDHRSADVAAAQENVTKNPLAISSADPHLEGGYTKVTQDWGTPRGITDPLTHLPVRNAKGEILLWPSGINPIEIYNSGLNSKSSEALSAGPILFSQNAYWDFQRGGSQNGKINHPEFFDASNVVIGLYNAAAGVPLSVTLTEQNNYARFKSRYKPGTSMDKTYTYLPARDVRNTIIGYELANSIRKARAT
jgi:hypothetical protein